MHPRGGAEKSTVLNFQQEDPFVKGALRQHHEDGPLPNHHFYLLHRLYPYILSAFAFTG